MKQKLEKEDCLIEVAILTTNHGMVWQHINTLARFTQHSLNSFEYRTIMCTNQICVNNCPSLSVCLSIWLIILFFSTLSHLLPLVK